MEGLGGDPLATTLRELQLCKSAEFEWRLRNILCTLTLTSLEAVRLSGPRLTRADGSPAPGNDRKTEGAGGRVCVR